MKRKFFVPPSGLNPAATAIASRRVDLPVPFSPTKKVTLECSAKVERSRRAGIEKGYSEGSLILGRRRAIDRTKASLIRPLLVEALAIPDEALRLSEFVAIVDTTLL
jgi:hypothetical protein